MFLTYYTENNIPTPIQPKLPSSYNIFDLEFTIDDFIQQSYAEEVVLDTKYRTTKTITIDKAPTSWSTTQANKMRQAIVEATQLMEPYLSKDMHEYYSVFQIPKKSGGLRTIKAPNEELKQVQTTIRKVFEYDLKMLSHNAAFAYTKQRCVKDALVLHQRNNSKWFLKMDLTNFFDNCNAELIIAKLKNIHPLSTLSQTHPTCVNTFLNAVVHIACLDGGLPQGTPLSPTLTNLIMTEFDFTLEKRLQNSCVYTRYADDLIISSQRKDNINYLTNLVKTTLQDTSYPFTIKEEKTRYGSSSGQNWNLGLMLNKDNDITIGYRNKKRIKSMLHSVYLYPENWSLNELQVLVGHLAYLESIEPEYHAKLINWFNDKYDTSIIRTIKTLIKSFA